MNDQTPGSIYRDNRFSLQDVFRISLVGRLTLAMGFMFILVCVSIGAGLWFSQSEARNLVIFQGASNNLATVYDLQTSWNAIVNAMDNMLISRTYADYEAQYDQSVKTFNEKLTLLTTQPPGYTAQSQTANRAIIEQLSTMNADLSNILIIFKTSSRESRWYTSIATRETTIAATQKQLDELFAQLTANLQGDMAASVADSTRAQNIARTYWAIAVLAALIFTVLIILLIRRVVAGSVNQLIAGVQRITQGDLSPVKTLPQRDEIGELSRAIALMTDWLRESYTTLEKRVTERTQELEKRTGQLQLAAQVAHDIISQRDLQELLNYAVNMIRQRFDFYHVGVFLVDDRYEFAVLRAATGEAGRQLLARGHKLKVGEVGIVGYVTKTGQSRVASEVGEDVVHFKNPLLPETRAEAALPLRVGERIIGALDVQSQQASAFETENLATLQILADQLATAIENAILLQELQENIRQLERLGSEYSRQAWEFLQSSQVTGYQYDGFNLLPLAEAQPDSATSSSHGHHKGEGDSSPVQIPLELRGQVIGTLDVWPQANSPASIDSTPLDTTGELPAWQIDFLRNLASRISQTLESARLFEQTRARVAREEAINRLTASFTRLLDADRILQTAAHELGQLPSVVEAGVFLVGQPTPVDTAASPSKDASEVASSTAEEPSDAQPGSTSPENATERIAQP
jgi:nitrate/nitrite-specific signal transduction histidine kinase